MADYHLNVKGHCDLKCLYCKGNQGDWSKLDELFHFSELKKELLLIKHNKEIDTIVIGGSTYEPTNFKYLPIILLIIKSMGLESILMTNGVRLGDEIYVKRLKESGLNKINIHLFEYNNFYGDKIMGQMGASENRKNALKNCKKYGIEMEILLLIIKSNYKNIFDIIENFKEFLDSKIINLKIFIYGYIKEADLLEGIKYNELLPYLIEFIQKRSNYKINIEGFPNCMISEYHNLELTCNTFGNEWAEIIKLNKCENCEFFNKKCYGIRKGYLDLYGDSEFLR